MKIKSEISQIFRIVGRPVADALSDSPPATWFYQTWCAQNLRLETQYMRLLRLGLTKMVRCDIKSNEDS